MIIVTGGFGFIGSNIIRNLNRRGIRDIVVVDDMTDGHKFKNLVDCEYEFYYDRDDFFEKFDNWGRVTQIYHEGAISSTTEWDGKLVMHYNYDYSCRLLDKAIEHKIPFSYASSASVYGNSHDFSEDSRLEPINMYAYSKMAFDQKVSRIINSDWYPNSPFIIQGYRYFNVYGDGEDHKGDQASPVTKFFKQAREEGVIRVFEGSDNFTRDFVCAEDIAVLKIEMLGRHVSGIFNAGTGHHVSFMDIARAVAEHTGVNIETIPFPNHLRGHYQEYTCADMRKLHGIGCPIGFRNVFEYIKRKGA